MCSVNFQGEYKLRKSYVCSIQIYFQTRGGSNYGLISFGSCFQWKTPRPHPITIFDTPLMLNQAYNQLRTPGVAKSFPRGPNLLNYVQHIFPGDEAPLRPHWLQPCAEPLAMS